MVAEMNIAENMSFFETEINFNAKSTSPGLL